MIIFNTMNQREMETLKELFVAVLQLSIHKKRQKSNKRLMARTITLRQTACMNQNKKERASPSPFNNIFKLAFCNQTLTTQQIFFRSLLMLPK
jgi:hypothetical protein